MNKQRYGTPPRHLEATAVAGSLQGQFKEPQPNCSCLFCEALKVSQVDISLRANSEPDNGETSRALLRAL